jgi:hypothetical protein
MSDPDPISELQARLTQLQTKLTYARTGKAPPKPVDLLHWRANSGADALAKDAGGVATIVRSLREDWQSLREAIRTWTLGVEERFGR